jgi:hypothetical protein
MSNRRLLRLLPDRSGLMLLAIALTAALALLGFGNLVISKSEALAEQYAARQQLLTLQEQNRRLVSALQQAEHGQNIVPRAWQYYHRLPPGLTVFEEQPPESSTAVQAGNSGGLPLWVQLVERLRLALTNPRIWVR